MYSRRYEEIKTIVKGFPVNKLIFWIGAGIDKDTPTMLPLGNEFTIDILERACGKDIAHKILEQWKISKENINSLVNLEINDYPRLETVLDIIKNFESKLSVDNSVLEGLKSFSEAPPNNNHYILAKLLHNGANIVTTNYDACISKAYNELYKDTYTLQLKQSNNIWIYESSYENAGKVYHIHGVAQCIDNIGATLSIVKNPIAKEFDKKMNEWIQNNSCFLYLGYGGVDTLDVTPYLCSLTRSKVSLGVYIRHSNNLGEKELVQERVNEKNLLSCFDKQYILYYNTYEFLSIFQDEKLSLLETPSYEWKKMYSVYSREYTSELKMLCTLGVLDKLNLNPAPILGINWPKYFKDNNTSQVDKWYLGNYGFRNCIRSNDKKNAKWFTNMQESSELLDSDIRAMKHLPFMLHIREWYTTKKLINSFQVSSFKEDGINWHISTPINRTVFFYLSIISQCPFGMNYVIRCLRKEALHIIELLEKIVNAGPLYILDINQMGVAYVDLGILELIFNKNCDKAWNYINLAQQTYVEVSSISGIINSLLFQIFYYEFEYWHNIKQNKKQILILYKQVKQLIIKEQYTGKYKSFLDIIIGIAKKIGIKMK